MNKNNHKKIMNSKSQNITDIMLPKHLEHINKMAQDIAQKMLPYILHMRGIKRRE